MARKRSRFNFVTTILGVCILFVVACSKKDEAKISRPTTLDPFSESFWNRNIHYMLRENPQGGYDTITFDRSGNIVKTVTFGITTLKREFDEARLLVREWRGDDLPENCLITYSQNKDLLIQTWERVKSASWDYDPKNVEKLKKWQVIMVMNSSNQVAKEINLKDDLVIDYAYSNSRIIKKQEFDLASEMKTVETEYYYQGDDLLKITEFFNGENVPGRIHYFGSGTLDSTQLFSPTLKLPQTTTYKFIYFESSRTN